MKLGDIINYENVSLIAQIVLAVPDVCKWSFPYGSEVGL
jgi:hypothetical protein